MIFFPAQTRRCAVDKVFDFLMLFFASVAVAGFATITLVSALATIWFLWKAIRDE